MIQIRQTILGLLWCLLCAVLAGSVFGAIWAITDYMRYFGTAFVPPPYLVHETKHLYPEGSFLAQLEDIIGWYNTNVKQAARFGSGFGMITGLLFAWGYVKKCRTPARIIVGIVSGGLIGGRISLILTPDPRFFLGGLIVGAALASWYLYIEGSADRLPELPLLELGKRNA